MKDETKYYEILDLATIIKKTIDTECENKYDAFTLIDIIFSKIYETSIITEKQKLIILNTMIQRILEKP